MLSIPSVKGVELGSGFASTAQPGSQVHDVLELSEAEDWQHRSNNAGGVEGGISNGAPIIVRGAVKPTVTLARHLCGNCSSSVTTTGVGKNASSVAGHSCTMTAKTVNCCD